MRGREDWVEEKDPTIFHQMHMNYFSKVTLNNDLRGNEVLP